MKNVALSQPRRLAARRAATYRPRLELLEGRLQPGSLLLGSLPGAALLDGDLGLDRQPAARPLVRHADVSPDTQTAHAAATVALLPGAARSAERLALVTAAAVVAAPAFGSSLADNLRAMNALAGRPIASPTTPAIAHTAGTASAASGLTHQLAAAAGAVAPGAQVVQTAPLAPAALTATIRPLAMPVRAAKLQETVLRAGDDSGQPPPPGPPVWSTYLGGDNSSKGQSVDQGKRGQRELSGRILPEKFTLSPFPLCTS
jgi:hypothetical protein